MKTGKFPITFLVLCTMASGVTSQNTYNGIVTDRNGNPIAGVRVTDGNGVGTTTNLYGQYEIAVPENNRALSFDLVGYNPLTKRTGPDMNVRLFKSRTFNTPNYGRHFFIGVQAATAEKSLRHASLGINLGVLKNRGGWYCDLVLPTVDGDLDYSPHFDPYMSNCLTGKRKSWAWHCSTGFMIPAPVINSLYLDAGVKCCYKKMVDECYYEDENRSSMDGCGNWSLEFGMSYRISHLMFNAKCGAFYMRKNDSYGVPSGNMKKFDSLSFGLSYIF